MPPGTKRPRGRPPLPEDNATRERLLEAARKLFSRKSFTQVSIRDITEEAGLGVAAVHYHFGSKNGLVLALFRRTAPAVIEQRLALLAAATARTGSIEERLDGVLYALLAPVIRWSREPEAQRYYIPFLMRAQLDGPRRIQELDNRNIRHLGPFREALQNLLPEMSEAEIGWRLHFVLGIEHAVMMEAQRMSKLTGGASDEEDDETVIRRVVEFARQGWLCAATSGRTS